MNTTSKLVGVVRGRAESALQDAIGNLITSTYITNVTWDSATNTLSFFSGNTLKYRCVIELSPSEFGLYVFTAMPIYANAPNLSYEKPYSRYAGCQTQYINGDSGDYIKKYGCFKQVAQDQYSLSSWEFYPLASPTESYPPGYTELCLHDPNSSIGDYYIIHGTLSNNTFTPNTFTSSDYFMVQEAHRIEEFNFYYIHSPSNPQDYKRATCDFSLASGGDYTDFSDWIPTLAPNNPFSALCLHDTNSQNYKFLKGDFSGTLSWSGLSFTFNTHSVDAGTDSLERPYLSLEDSDTHNILHVIMCYTLNSGTTGDRYSDWELSPLAFPNYPPGYVPYYYSVEFQYNNVHTFRVYKGSKYIEMYSPAITQNANYTDGLSYDQYTIEIDPYSPQCIKFYGGDNKALKWFCSNPSLNSGGNPNNYDDYSVGPQRNYYNMIGKQWNLEIKSGNIVNQIGGNPEINGETEFDEWVFTPVESDGSYGTPGRRYTYTNTVLGVSVEWEYVNPFYNLIEGRSGQSVDDYYEEEYLPIWEDHEQPPVGELIRFYYPDGKSYKEAFGFLRNNPHDPRDENLYWVFPESGNSNVTWKLYSGESYKIIKGSINEVDDETGDWWNIIGDPLSLTLTPSIDTSDKTECKMFINQTQDYYVFDCLYSTNSTTPRDYGNFWPSGNNDGFHVLHNGLDEKWVYGTFNGSTFTPSTSTTAHKWHLCLDKETSITEKIVYGKFELVSGGSALSYADYSFTLTTSVRGDYKYADTVEGGYVWTAYHRERHRFSETSGTTDYDKFRPSSTLYYPDGYTAFNSTFNSNYVNSDSFTSSTALTSGTRVLRKGKDIKSITGTNWTISGDRSVYSNWSGPNSASPTGYISDGTITIYGTFTKVNNNS